jgi:hypothetical protein
MFTEALTANWWRARDAYMPDGPKTRDERYVWEALRLARTDDVRAVLESTTGNPKVIPAWLGWHPTWVRALMVDAVGKAVHVLRQAKRDRRAMWRRDRYTSRSHGKRRSVRRPGPLPPITVKVGARLTGAHTQKVGAVLKVQNKL